VAILGSFGLICVAATLALRVPEARSALRAPFARRR
jgi:hypothetical protein